MHAKRAGQIQAYLNRLVCRASIVVCSQPRSKVCHGTIVLGGIEIAANGAHNYRKAMPLIATTRCLKVAERVLQAAVQR